MPILPQEPDMFPEDLLSDDSAAAPAERWWALYTMARREKELMRRLRAMGIGHYGPLIARKTKSPGGRIRVSHLPLFAGYVFLRGNESDRYRAWTTNCVSRCLAVDAWEELVRDLRQIHHLVRSGAPISPESKIQPGARIRVRSGPLAGMEGAVIKRRGKDRFLVAVHLLQRGASVELEDYEVERLDF